MINNDMILRRGARIKVVGIGGGGCNAVNRMIEVGIRGVTFVAINTDAQALSKVKAEFKLQIGSKITRGLGSGADPSIGKKAAEADAQIIEEALKDTDLVFITCGMGGGTGTGASPVVSRISTDLGALTIAVVTKPFSFEGKVRSETAKNGIKELQNYVDTLITVPNDKLLEVIQKKTTLLQAFQMCDDVLRQGVQGISDLIVVPGLINLDFADVKTIMSKMGTALIGIGVKSGDDRAVQAAKTAISCPLLEHSIDGAKGIIFNVCGGKNMTLHEVDKAAKIIYESAAKDANIIFGATIDENMNEDIRVTVVATGFLEKNFIQKNLDNKIKLTNKEIQIPSFLKK